MCLQAHLGRLRPFSRGGLAIFGRFHEIFGLTSQVCRGKAARRSRPLQPRQKQSAKSAAAQRSAGVGIRCLRRMFRRHRQKDSFGADKPDSVPPGLAGVQSSFLFHFRLACARLRQTRRCAICTAYRRMRHTRGYRTGRPASYFVLHRKGFFVPPASRRGAVGSCPTFSPLPWANRSGLPRVNPELVEGSVQGGLFSVTLSVAAA